MKKALVITSVASMIDQFCLPSISVLQNLGYKVDVACNFIQGNTCTNEKIEVLKDKLSKLNVCYYQIDFARNVSKMNQNIRAFCQIQNLLKVQQYDLVHCHSPIGGLLTRFAANKYRKRGTKVIYTAHGFHFYKGAPLLNWLLYYPIEKICSHMTDVLITINREDYAFAQSKMKAGKIAYVPGIGIDIEKFNSTNVNKLDKRRSLGIPDNGILILSVGELNQNKNHQLVINAISQLHNDNIYYAIAGRGELKDELEQLAKQKQVNLLLLGFRTDVAELYKTADLFVHPSFREGLPVSLMEAIASSTPVLCSDIRGNVDLVNSERRFCGTSVEELVEKLQSYLLKSHIEDISSYTCLGKYDIESVSTEMRGIYSNLEKLCL